MIVAMNRWVPMTGFGPAADQPLTAVADAVRPVSRLGAALDFCRHVSGIAAIGVLGIAMFALALRAEERPSRPIALAPGGVADVSEPPLPPAASPVIVYRDRLPPMTVVYYVFETEAQREMVLYAEMSAGMEGDMDLVSQHHRYELLDASTPEGEQLARDAIYEAMLTADSRTRIVVEDVRGH